MRQQEEPPTPAPLVEEDRDSERASDLLGAFADKVGDGSTTGLFRQREEAVKQAAAQERAGRKMAREARLRADGVSPARIRWGYTKPGPEPKPLVEISGLLAAAAFFLLPLGFIAYGQLGPRGGSSPFRYSGNPAAVGSSIDRVNEAVRRQQERLRQVAIQDCLDGGERDAAECAALSE